MTPAQAVYRMVSGRWSASSEDRASLPERMTEIERAAGTKTAAARSAGVSLRTWQRWRAGTQRPRPAALARLRGVQRRTRLSPAREARLRSGRGVLVVEGQLRVSSDSRHRTVAVDGQDVDDDARDALVDAYLRNDADAMEDALNGWLAAYWPGMVAEEVDRISFG